MTNRIFIYTPYFFGRYSYEPSTLTSAVLDISSIYHLSISDCKSYYKASICLKSQFSPPPRDKSESDNSWPLVIYLSKDDALRLQQAFIDYLKVI